jgi:hypothetical protein
MIIIYKIIIRKIIIEEEINKEIKRFKTLFNLDKYLNLQESNYK